MPVPFVLPKYDALTSTIIFLNSMLLAKISPGFPGLGRSGQLKRYPGLPPSEESTHVQFTVFCISEVWHKIQGHQNVMSVVS